MSLASITEIYYTILSSNSLVNSANEPSAEELWSGNDFITLHKSSSNLPHKQCLNTTTSTNPTTQTTGAAESRSQSQLQNVHWNKHSLNLLLTFGKKCKWSLEINSYYTRRKNSEPIRTNCISFPSQKHEAHKYARMMNQPTHACVHCVLYNPCMCELLSLHTASFHRKFCVDATKQTAPSTNPLSIQCISIKVTKSARKPMLEKKHFIARHYSAKETDVRGEGNSIQDVYTWLFVVAELFRRC